jgi:DNA-binding transcriptional regulator YiaG
MTHSQIRTLRGRLKLSRERFAAALGFAEKNPRRTVGRWDSGERKLSEQTIILMWQLTEGTT